MLMDDVVSLVRELGLPAIVTLLLLVIIYWALSPEKAQIFSSQVWKVLAAFPLLFRGAHKRYVRHSLQGRLGDFTRKLRKTARFLPNAKPSIRWVTGAETDREAFLQGDRVILRLRREDPEDRNFVHGAYLYVSKHLLGQTKRYVAPAHRDSIDLFVTGQLLQEERPSVVGFYLDEYVHPRTERADSKIGGYFDAYTHMDEAGVFYDVLLQELHFLGLKVFGRRRDDQIIIEVNGLIDYLEKFAGRSIGEDLDSPSTTWKYCRLAVVIVGKSHNISPGGETWTSYIRKNLLPQGVETLYLLALQANREVVEAVAKSLGDSYDTELSRSRTVVLKYGDRRERRKQYLLVMRRRGIPVFQASGDDA
jgi:hypothetical protein